MEAQKTQQSALSLAGIGLTCAQGALPATAFAHLEPFFAVQTTQLLLVHVNTQTLQHDVKGRFLDNIFIERLWRTPKYECVYPYAWETGSEAKASISKWMTFYNHQRPHLGLGGRPPAVVYWLRKDKTQPGQQVQKVA